ncbi:MAG TPA: efflux RND transporter periplasmic adaptor subunit, partial [Chryseosolibacter sp.]|nr:efflux RND transporter periplasmic adaptor subunit [Chryseosolibacter sp.]
MKTLSLYILPFIVLLGCSGQANHEGHNEVQPAAETASTQFTCPMHPQIIQDKPGTCPICGMDLVEVTKGSVDRDGLMLTDSQMKLANITTQPVSAKPIGQTVVINGRLTVDEQKTEIISSRAGGRIEKLFIKETGQSIRKGDPLYTLYSEELLTLQQEYLLAREQYETLGQGEKRYKSFLDAAERKLILYGLTQSQISQLRNKNASEPRVTFLAPASGIVTEINGAEGQYVAEGAALYKIEDIGSLWVEAELYPNETSLVSVGDEINVRISGTENASVEADVNFLSPEFRNGTQITIIRASIDNADNRFKPGQHAQVFLTHSSREGIAVPVNAVIRDGKGSHVYVLSGNNTFRPQMVKTGIEG